MFLQCYKKIVVNCQLRQNNINYNIYTTYKNIFDTRTTILNEYVPKDVTFQDLGLRSLTF